MKLRYCQWCRRVKIIIATPFGDYFLCLICDNPNILENRGIRK